MVILRLREPLLEKKPRMCWGQALSLAAFRRPSRLSAATTKQTRNTARQTIAPDPERTPKPSTAAANETARETAVDISSASIGQSIEFGMGNKPMTPRHRR